MCYETKKRIADCVKDLMKKKSISKITINDVVTEAKISRQSFYYHFKDIYDVLEWSYKYDFVKQFPEGGTISVEEWLVQIYRLIDTNRSFVYRVISEIPWHAVVRSCAPALKENIKQLLLENEEISSNFQNDHAERVADFVATSFLYYLLDVIYTKKELTPASFAPVFRSFIFCVNVGSENFPQVVKAS